MTKIAQSHFVFARKGLFVGDKMPIMAVLPKRAAVSQSFLSSRRHRTQNQPAMKMYQFLAQESLALAITAKDACTKIAASPSLFQISPTNADALAAAANEFASDVNAVQQARLALEAAILARNHSRNAFARLFQQLLAQAYINPEVSNESLVSINLDARETRQSRPVRQPLDLTVIPRENGTIKATWKRNKNTNVTVFTLQVFVEAEWQSVWSGTRVRVELPGFAPGVERKFRVIASKSGDVSVPSDSWTIYGAGSALPVRAAA